jgi:membrane protein YqaA with SNARE-associated domain
MNHEPAATAIQRQPNLLRRLYEWTIGWAERRGGTWALFIIAVAESSFFPIPPDVLLLALCVGAPRKSFRFALVCSIGSVTGGMLGYAIGYGAWQAVHEFFIPYIFSQAAFDKVQQLYQGSAFMAILSAAFTPIPYKVFTIAAGAFNVGFWTLVVASLIGRSGRFFLVAGMIYLFGTQVKALIEKYFDWFTWLFLILLIGGFLLVNYLK